MALWQWTLPLRAEPLLEFGNTAIYRIIWVQRLGRGRAIKSIGTGIIGSSHEEKSRATLDWNEGDVLLVPSNDGKAVGWIHEESSTSSDDDAKGKDDSQSVATGVGPAVLFIAKVPSALILDDGGELRDGNDTSSDDEDYPQWSRDVASVCARAIKTARRDEAPTADIAITRIPSDDAELFRKTVTGFLN